MDTKIRAKSKSSLKLKNLRLSLKYRPDILKLILKMRYCLKKKNYIISRLKKQLKLLINIKVTSSFVQTDDTVPETNKVESDPLPIIDLIDNDKILSDVSTQTGKLQISDDETDKKANSIESEKSEWKQDDEDKGKTIAEQVKEAAQSALNESGMVYVESAGMYYDYKTGYYYNSELGLYYHTDTGCYYYYSDEKKKFEFHSYPDRSAEIENAPLFKHVLKKAKKHKKEMRSNIDNLTKKISQDKEDEEVSKPKKKKTTRRKKKIEVQDVEKPETIIEDAEIDMQVDGSEDSQKEVKDDEVKDGELEDGECSETDCEEVIEDEDDVESIISKSTATDDDDSVAKHHPPCMRLIVRETNVQKLKIGSLFVITKDGGSIGREGEQHAIVIKDNNVSKNHLEIRYNLQRNIYMATDLGSKNGTILNGTRMSESQDMSTPIEVLHGSTLQVGGTKLLCHIHSGNETCGHCEPGLLMDSEEKDRKVAYTRTCSVQRQHQLELARLKNKYSKPLLAVQSEAYNDRAQARRHAVGSSHSAEKTQSSDINSFMPSENKGFKLLEKMGWSKGEGLGKDNQGDKEPIPLVSNESRAGLGATGAEPAHPPRPPPSSSLGPATLRLAARTKMLQPPAKAFQNSLIYDSD